MRIALVLSIAIAAAAPAASAGGVWQAPACATVAGTDFVTFSRDAGRSLVPTHRWPRGISYTLGLVALRTPNVLLAVHDRWLLRSEDSGCTWLRAADLGSPLWHLVAAGGGAYAWYENEGTIWRIDRGGRGGRRGTVAMALPSGGLRGLGVDPVDRRHLRIVGDDGVVYDSADGAATWRRRGALPAADTGLVYQAAFDPRDLDHLVVGVARSGAYVSFDGGREFARAGGLSAGPVNVFSSAISPADGRVVWVMGLDLDQSDAGVPSEGRHLYRSEDGGRSFARVVDEDRRITLRNGPVLAPHPTRRDQVYFVFGTFFDDYGTDLYLYDHRAHRVTVSHSAYDDLTAVAFNPVSPDVLYVGVTSERGIQ